MIFFFIVCLLAFMATQDAKIRIRRIVSTGWAHTYVDKRVHELARLLFALAGMLQDVRILRDVDAVDKLPDQFVLLSNHQSLIDIPVLVRSFPRAELRFAGKKELFHYIPLVSIMFRLQRHACIDRKGNFARTVKELEGLAVRARSGATCPTIFPEGTRSRDGALGPFHHGAVRSVLRLHPMPVVTVALDGGYRASRVHQFLKNLRHLHYRVRVLSVQEAPKTKSDIDAVLARSRTAIEEQLVQWRSAFRTPAEKIDVRR